MTIKSCKYEGCGNDFILIDNRTRQFEPDREQVRILCDRHFGIGADGLMLLESDPQAEFRMRYFNCDGGEATMCGNGGRCIALFAHHLGIGGAMKHFTGIDGQHTVELLEEHGRQGVLRLGMIDVDKITRGDNYLFLNTGSPHYVEFCDDPDGVDLRSYGARVRNDERFAPGGTNVNLVRILKPDTLYVRTYERGVEDETLACGTGVTASALAAAYHTGSSCRNFEIITRGGRLNVSFESNDLLSFRNIRLTGAARHVFSTNFEF